MPDEGKLVAPRDGHRRPSGAGMAATLAGAQTDEVKEKPRLIKYESYWTFPPAHWGDVDKDNATSNQKVPLRLRSPTAPSSATATTRTWCAPGKPSPTATGGWPTHLPAC
jgi:hypothetical protein